MSIEISAHNPRSIRAIEIAAAAARWLHIREAGTARVIGYQIPSESQPGVWHVVTPTFCACPDAQRHPGQACKHVLAVRLHCELAKASAPRRRTQSTRKEVYAF